MTGRRKQHVDGIAVIAHVFLAVLIGGTVWRMATYYFLASKSPQLNHLGKAMAIQY